jgi:hypothetical protein
MPNLDKIYLWRGQVIFQGNDGTPYVPPDLPNAVYVTYASDEGGLPTAMLPINRQVQHRTRGFFC